jgi:hypothetical protein
MVFLFSPEVVSQVPSGEIGSSRGAQLIPGKIKIKDELISQ